MRGKRNAIKMQSSLKNCHEINDSFYTWFAFFLLFLLLILRQKASSICLRAVRNFTWWKMTPFQVWKWSTISIKCRLTLIQGMASWITFFPFSFPFCFFFFFSLGALEFSWDQLYFHLWHMSPLPQHKMDTNPALCWCLGWKALIRCFCSRGTPMGKLGAWC